MKKFALMLVMMFTVSMGVFAEDNNVSSTESIEKYDFNIDHRKLACFLDLCKDQMEPMDDVVSNFERGMLYAAGIDNEETRNKMLYIVISDHMKYTNFILNKKQYKKYSVVLNATLVNRGFNMEEINKYAK